LQPTRSARIATFLFDLLWAAKGKTRDSPRLLQIVALSQQVTCLVVQMETQLLFELFFQLSSAPDAGPPTHRPPPSPTPTIQPTALPSRRVPESLQPHRSTAASSPHRSLAVCVRFWSVDRISLRAPSRFPSIAPPEARGSRGGARPDTANPPEPERFPAILAQ